MTGRRNQPRKALLFSLLLICLLVVLLSAPQRPTASQAQSRQGQSVATGQATPQTFSVRVQGPMRGPLLKSPPAERREREENEERKEREHPSIKVPIDPTVRPEDIRPTSPPTTVRLLSEQRTAVPQAPGTFTFFRNTTTGDNPMLPGVGAPTFSPYEPSVGVNGRVVFYTTNNYAAVSGDRGQTYSYINPADNFPADNVTDALNGGFGGDQYAYYVRTHGLMCWLIQYNPDNNNNTYRLAVARSQSDLLNNTWLVYDFTPATFGLTTPPGATGVWLDFPDLSVSDNFLYFTANYFPRRTTTTGPPTCVIACPGGTCPMGCASCTGCGSLGAVIARIPLAALAQGNNFTGNFFNDTTHFSLRLTHGAHETMYWGAHNSNTQIRIYRWPESGNITFNDVNHAAYNGPGRGGHVATCAGGTNYLSFDDERIMAAWVANSVIGFMWNAAQGGGFARPHVQVLRFNEADSSLLTQGQIFNNDIAFAYPSVHPNDRGHLGGTIAFGCGNNTGNPGVAAWIADDFNNNTITPLETLGAISGNRSEGRWGDYFSTRIYSPYGNTWVGTGFALNTPNARDHRFVWFGRERDIPPATNVIFVSKFNTTGYEDGTLFHPYNTVAEGHFATTPGDIVSIAPANYNEPQILNRASRLERLGTTGSVKIGQP
jgi:hypothetical protein